jgi:hypothetical protein
MPVIDRSILTPPLEIIPLASASLAVITIDEAVHRLGFRYLRRACHRRASDPDALDWPPVWIEVFLVWCAEWDLPVLDATINAPKSFSIVAGSSASLRLLMLFRTAACLAGSASLR